MTSEREEGPICLGQWWCRNRTNDQNVCMHARQTLIYAQVSVAMCSKRTCASIAYQSGGRQISILGPTEMNRNNSSSVIWKRMYASHTLNWRSRAAQKIRQTKSSQPKQHHEKKNQVFVFIMPLQTRTLPILYSIHQHLAPDRANLWNEYTYCFRIRPSTFVCLLARVSVATDASDTFAIIHLWTHK